MNKQKYSNNVSIKKGRLRIKEQTTKCSIKKKTDKNIQQQHCNQLVYIYRQRQKHSPSAFIKLRTLRY